jgi:hypothetical protein
LAQPEQYESGSAAPRFHFNAAPETPVITLTSERGSQTTLYASGRFTQRSRRGQVIETHCSFEEVQGLLTMLATHGLLDLDTKELTNA